MLAARRVGTGWRCTRAWCRRGDGSFRAGGEGAYSRQVLIITHEMQKRHFTYFDDFGKLLRDEERAREAVFMLKRETELLELLFKDASKLEEAKRVCMQIKAHVQAQQMLHGELNDAKAALQYISFTMPSWLGVHQIVHAPM